MKNKIHPLTRERNKSGMTQGKLAQRVKRSQAHISYIEAGTEPAGAELIGKFIKVFPALTLQDFLKGKK